jgi:ABC-type transporter MlaC component
MPRLGGKVSGFTSARALGALLFIATALLAAAWGEPETGAAEPVMRQLEAFRRDDFDTAYTFASEEIRQLFDRQAFERMVRGGYPEIARSTSAAVIGSRRAPDGTVYLRLRVVGANGNSIEAVYEMVQEAGTWKINGVVARPAPGQV